jgi:hypothetical protein
MRFKKPYMATMDQVRITREARGAVIEYAEDGVSTVHLTLEPERMAPMTDEDILDLHNQCISASQNAADAFEYVAVEIPPGRPQVEYAAASDQWVPRGGVLRCVIDDTSEDDDPVVIHIDDREFSLREFGRMLRTYVGWGMRITFVPDDELHDEPDIEVREPAK